MALIITQFHLSPSASIQKRLKKEKKAKRKLQEALEFESKRRERVEDALKHSSSSSPSPEPLHAANNNTNNGTTGCLLVCLLPFCLTSRSNFCFHIFYCSLGFLTLLFFLLGFQSAVTVFCFYCFSLDSFCCIFANQTFLFSLHLHLHFLKGLGLFHKVFLHFFFSQSFILSLRFWSVVL